MVPPSPTPRRIVWRLINIGRSSTKVLTEHPVLLVSGFNLAPGPGIFTLVDQLVFVLALQGKRLWALTFE